MEMEFASLMEEYGGKLYEGYSGRGMYGNKTTGVTFYSMGDALRAAALAGYDMRDKDVPEDFIPTSFATDSMGLDIIVY